MPRWWRPAVAYAPRETAPRRATSAGPTPRACRSTMPVRSGCQSSVPSGPSHRGRSTLESSTFASVVSTRSTLRAANPTRWPARTVATPVAAAPPSDLLQPPTCSAGPDGVVVGGPVGRTSARGWCRPGCDREVVQPHQTALRGNRSDHECREFGRIDRCRARFVALGRAAHAPWFSRVVRPGSAAASGSGTRPLSGTHPSIRRDQTFPFDCPRALDTALAFDNARSRRSPAESSCSTAEADRRGGITELSSGRRAIWRRSW